VGRMLVVLGLILAAAGGLLLLLQRLGVAGLGRLPGDLVWRGRGFTAYFPLGTSLLLSVVLSLGLWLLSRLFR
jgi:hypothetical protein